jgi:hypothetical protein
MVRMLHASRAGDGGCEAKGYQKRLPLLRLQFFEKQWLPFAGCPSPPPLA